MGRIVACFESDGNVCNEMTGNKLGGMSMNVMMYQQMASHATDANPTISTVSSEPDGIYGTPCYSMIRFLESC